MSSASVRKTTSTVSPTPKEHLASTNVFTEPALDPLELVAEVTAPPPPRSLGRQTGFRLFRDRHHDRQPLFPRDFLCRGQDVIDGTGVEIAFAKWRRVSAIEELARVPDFEVDTGPALLDAIACGYSHPRSSFHRRETLRVASVDHLDDWTANALPAIVPNRTPESAVDGGSRRVHIGPTALRETILR